MWALAGSLFILGVLVGAVLSELVRRWMSQRCPKANVVRKLARIYAQLSHPNRKTLLREDSADLADLMNNQFEQLRASEHDDLGKDTHMTYLAVDIGGTRTKLKWVEKAADGSHSERLLTPLESQDVWGACQCPSFASSPSSVPSAPTNEMMATRAADTLSQYLSKQALNLRNVNRLVFSVPGTVDLSSVNRDEISVVKNMPSFSKSFRGFDFKKHFRPLCHPQDSKVSAIADNLAAAMGVASTYPQYRSGLVIVLGTAPAVSTFYKQTDHITLGKQDPYLETAIWQSWVWFTKIELKDPFGYCGGIHVRDHGKSITLKNPKESYKIPHGQARIRFALDNDTWLRLRGKCPNLPAEIQGSLSDEEATQCWAERFQSAVNALAQKFHMIYGPPDCIFVLGGNSMRLHGEVTHAEYQVPDMMRPQTNTVAVTVLPSDDEQQDVHMNGLITSTRYKVKQVFAPGNDPLSRGWTRGGEIYVWVPRFRSDALLRGNNGKNDVLRRRQSNAASGLSTALLCTDLCTDTHHQPLMHKRLSKVSLGGQSTRSNSRSSVSWDSTDP